MGPADAQEPDPMEVGPHPHIGLSTVTWLLDGEALHSDSLGTEQVIRPGQLNWMTAGHRIAHAELAARPPFRGVQMWVAQPRATRHGQPTFVVRRGRGRHCLSGGEPLGEPIEMWWNFVAGDRDEITTAWRDWRDRTDRFGEVASPLERIEAPPPPWVPLSEG